MFYIKHSSDRFEYRPMGKACAAGQTTPASAQAQAAGNFINTCPNAKIAEVRNTSPYEPITQDLLDESKKNCKASQ
ncbi:hypothetical protein [Undibacterium griseum]|uniref:Uncharacterized protein n=1 Tax=Undibacterium griseum TaxID=2762295 RepID=A0ABR6YQ01_9BURK|nr:hypothetical protein [Undibacterium griseum]MBC3885962.1 hypothetical protein [Undibacterium griseum]